MPQSERAQGIRDKWEIEDEGEEEGTGERGKGSLSQRDKGETDVAHRKMAVYNDKGGNPVLG